MTRGKLAESGELQAFFDRELFKHIYLSIYLGIQITSIKLSICCEVLVYPSQDLYIYLSIYSSIYLSRHTNNKYEAINMLRGIGLPVPRSLLYKSFDIPKHDELVDR